MVYWITAALEELRKADDSRFHVLKVLENRNGKKRKQLASMTGGYLIEVDRPHVVCTCLYRPFMIFKKIMDMPDVCLNSVGFTSKMIEDFLDHQFCDHGYSHVGAVAYQ